jgi:hypothetical protein
VGATAPALAAASSADGAPGGDWTLDFADGDIISFVVSGVVDILKLRISLDADRVLP